MSARLHPRSCPTGKWVYESEKYARNGVRYMKEHGQIRSGRAYKCDRCPGWHVTSNTKHKSSRRKK